RTSGVSLGEIALRRDTAAPQLASRLHCEVGRIKGLLLRQGRGQARSQLGRHPKVAITGRRRRTGTLARAIAASSSAGLDGNSRANRRRRNSGEADLGSAVALAATRVPQRKPARGSPARRARWMMAPSVPIGTPPIDRLIALSDSLRANASSTTS